MAYTEEDLRDNIIEVQEFLEAISYINPKMPLIIPDGLYGGATRDAILMFQKEVGLPETGEVDIYTWNKLVDVYGDAITNYKGPEPILPNPASDIELKLSDTGNLIYILQVMINTIAEYYMNINRLNLTGEFDKATELAVKNLQVITLLPPTGIVDILTWNALARVYNFHASK